MYIDFFRAQGQDFLLTYTKPINLNCVVECDRQNGSRSLLFGLLRATLQEYAADSSDTGR